MLKAAEVRAQSQRGLEQPPLDPPLERFLRLAAARRRGNIPARVLKARRNAREQGYTRAAGKCVASCNDSFLLFG